MIFTFCLDFTNSQNQIGLLKKFNAQQFFLFFFMSEGGSNTCFDKNCLIISLNDKKFPVEREKVEKNAPGMLEFIKDEDPNLIIITEKISEETLSLFIKSVIQEKYNIDMKLLFDLELMAEKYQNKLLHDKILSYSRNIPKAYIVLNRILSKNKFGIDNKKEIEDFASNFDEYILPAYYLHFDPFFIINNILNHEKFHTVNPHNCIEYILLRRLTESQAKSFYQSLNHPIPDDDLQRLTERYNGFPYELDNIHKMTFENAINFLQKKYNALYGSDKEISPDSYILLNEKATSLVRQYEDIFIKNGYNMEYVYQQLYLES